MPLGQSIRPDEHQRPNRAPIQKLSYSDGVAHDDIALELSDLVGRDHAVFEAPKPSSDPIDDAPLGHEPRDSLLRTPYALTGHIRQFYPYFPGRFPGSSHCHHVCNGQMFTVNANTFANTCHSLSSTLRLIQQEKTGGTPSHNLRSLHDSSW